jgi:cytochrome c oxidase subunit 3
MAEVTHAGPEHHDERPEHAHHFESPAQQFEAGKLGMWIFLASEILLFGGLFCGYAVYRALHPEVFIYASLFLDRVLGGINTGVLICSSFTMAWAVRAAQLGQRRLLIVLLSLTLLGGVGFMGIKYFEYKHKWEYGLLWGTHYQSQTKGAHGHGEAPEDPELAAALAVAEETRSPDEAVPVPNVEGEVPETTVAEHTAASLEEPAETTEEAAEVGAAQDAQPVDVPDEDVGPGVPTEVPEQVSEAAAASLSGSPAGGEDRSMIAPAAQGPAGLAPTPQGEMGALETAAAVAEPQNVHLFFGIYFTMTGLHALHVIVGMGMIGWILLRSVRGEFGPRYFTPVDVVGLYWHLVDLIWIFLFPLLYLIE